MALSLPFFKFDVIAWLTSEKIAFMEAQHVGAYIMLLAQCWTQESCTLPNDLSQLKTWGKWKDECHGDFAPVLACFEPFKKTGRLTNHRLYQEWVAAKQTREVLSESGQRGALKRWAPKTPKLKVERAPVVDWMTMLRANVAYTHINIDTELGKMDAWLSTRPGRKKSKKFVVDWLNRIEAPLSNGHAGYPTRCMICEKDYPDHGALKTHNVLYHPKYVG